VYQTTNYPKPAQILSEEGNIPVPVQESPGILQLIDQLEKVADNLLIGYVILAIFFTFFTHL
jgi:hypothetical protein